MQTNQNFLLPEYINSDRYYNNLTDNISDKLSKIFFLPTVVVINKIDILKLNQIYKDIRNSNRNFLVKEDYLNIFDLFYSFFHYFRLIRLKKYNFKHNKVDYSKLIYSELYSSSGFNMSIEAILNYRFIKKLKLNKIKLKYFINWWENQPLDKSFNFALKKFYQSVKVVGYLGYVPRNLELNIYPVDNEIDSKVIPDTVLVIGKSYVANISKLTKKLQVRVSPALRFEHLWQNINISRLNFKYIFIPLPMLLNESIQILSMVIKLLEINKFDIKFLVKSHPAIKKDVLYNKFNFPKNIIYL